MLSEIPETILGRRVEMSTQTTGDSTQIGVINEDSTHGIVNKDSTQIGRVNELHSLIEDLSNGAI